MIIKNISEYPKSGYMQGTCPKCKKWEAPITEEELKKFNQPFAHHGSTERLVDEGVLYHREVWKECFQCPECKTKFSVQFSST